MPEPTNDRLRFEQDLPFFINGTLDKAGQAWMEAQLAAHPEWRSECELARDMREVVRSAASPVSEDERWRSLRARLVEEGVLGGAPQATGEETVDSPWRGVRARSGGRATAWLRPLAIPWPVVALGVAALLVQGYWLAAGSVSRPGPAPSELYRGEQVDRSACTAPRLRVTVAPSMTVGRWSELLMGLQVTVVQGPSDGNVWLLQIGPGQDLTQVQTAFRTASGVEDVQVIPVDGAACR